jgi:hypothetical protein
MNINKKIYNLSIYPRQHTTPIMHVKSKDYIQMQNLMYSPLIQHGNNCF